MRKKKIEKFIFSILMLLPLIMFLAWLFVCLIRNNHGTFDLTSVVAYENLLSFISLDSLNGFLVQPITYFLNIFSVPELISNCLALYIQYIVVIELLHLLYDVIIFIPRACRSIVEKGM